MRRRRRAAVLATVILLTTILAGCEVGRVGARCRGTGFGRDGTHVLVCKNGRWTRGMSLSELGRLAREAREASRRPLTVGPGLAVGNSVSCAIVPGGWVKCWGSNANGALGIGPVEFVKGAPVVVAGVIGATAIDMSDEAACVVVAEGRVRCWGRNLVDPGGAPQAVSVEVPGIVGATQVAVGGRHACALVEPGGAVWCWGSNAYGELGPGAAGGTGPASTGVSGATSVATGEGHSCAVVAGDVLCWGRNHKGQLGDASYDDRATPEPAFLIFGNAVSVEASVAGTCVTGYFDLVSCWGDNEFGRLGIDGNDTVPVPTPVEGGVGVTLAGGHGCAWTGDGFVSCWGTNLFNQLGLGGRFASEFWVPPTTILDFGGVVEVDAGPSHACARLVDHTVACWGSAATGELGERAIERWFVNAPTLVTEVP